MMAFVEWGSAAELVATRFFEWEWMSWPECMSYQERVNDEVVAIEVDVLQWHGDSLLGGVDGIDAGGGTSRGLPP